MGNETRWFEALRDSDQRFDGRFFAGVITTGVYCRSICPAPQPAAFKNIEFYPSAAAAQEHGFRACRTCHPERSPGTPHWSHLTPIVSRALELISDGALDDAGVDELARRLGVTARHLRRLFMDELGAPPIAIAKARRTHFARRLIDETDLPFAEVAFASGFSSVRSFNADLRAAFGRSPTELRRRKPRKARPDGAIELRMTYRPPLDWPRAIRYLQGRATPGIEVAEHDRYRRTIVIDGHAAAIEISPVADKPVLLLRAWLPSVDGLIGVSERARRLFDLNADPLEVTEGLRGNDMVGRMARSRPGMRVPQAWDPFELAVRAIIGQQVSVRGATTIAGRLVRTLGKPVPELDLPGLTHTFPSVATLADADMADLGMTGAQQRAIRALARAVLDGDLELSAPRGLEEFVGRLRELPGIGPWTAHYIAMRGLGEPDAFPASDLGLRRALATGDTLPTARAIEAMAEAWRPWRSYAAMYLWEGPTRGKRGTT